MESAVGRTPTEALFSGACGRALMLRVPIAEAEPGMKLAVDVCHPQRGNRLLRRGFELDRQMITKLADLRVHEVWIGYPDTAQIKQYISPVVMEYHGRMVSQVASMFDSVHRGAHARLDFPGYRRTLTDLICSLVGEPTAAMYIVEMGGAEDNNLRHASEVCFLSVLLGLKLQGYLVMQRRRLQPSQARNVVSLGLGAMMHDIGMTALDEGTRRRYGLTRDTSDPAWRRHPALGHRMVSGTISPAASGVVLHHHQHYDGSGFPTQTDSHGRRRGLVGEAIHVFARIVCVADHFDRLRYDVDGTVQPRVRVLRRLLMSDLTRRFDPVVLAALPLVVPAYPPGSVVTLNDGRRAVVLNWHPDSPCQPTVQLLNDDGPSSRDDRDEPTTIDLRERTDLLIAEQDGVNVSRDNFRLLIPIRAEKEVAV
jgi:HD-GYP domain-containing protein (c-di-GMP phosphodiesterase class II)